jgi:hypothetical protein
MICEIWLAKFEEASGVWCVVCGVWCVVCGVWCVVCGVWCVVCGVWCVVTRFSGFRVYRCVDDELSWPSTI